MNWQEFEQYSREFIRSIGYYVHPGPFLLQHKNIDIYGEHLTFSKYFDKNYYPYLFIGECKKWQQPVGPAVVYELQGLVSSLPTHYQIEAGIFSYSGFSKKAASAMLEANIHRFGTDTITGYLHTRFQNASPGVISRPSFPGYSNIPQLMDLLDTCVNLKKSTFTSTDLKPMLTAKGWTIGNMKWITSLLNISVILNLLHSSGKKGRSNLYTFSSDTGLVVANYQNDPKSLPRIIGPIVAKNRWMREILFYIRLNPDSSISSVANALEYSQAGFDKESIKMAIRLGRDLDLISFENRKLSLYSSTIQMLW